MHSLFVSQPSTATSESELGLEGLLASDVQLLTQIGFVAAGEGDTKQASAIFAGLQALRPQRAFAWVGEATAWLNAGKPAEAVRCLRTFQALPGQELDMVQAFLGLALQLDGQRQASLRILQTLASQSVSPATEGMLLARQILGSNMPEDFDTPTLGGPAMPVQLP